jgi:hypothetical protein
MIEMQIADFKMGYTLEPDGLEEPFLTQWIDGSPLGHPCWPTFLAPPFILEFFFDSIWLVRRPTSIVKTFTKNQYECFFQNLKLS